MYVITDPNDKDYNRNPKALKGSFPTTHPPEMLLTCIEKHTYVVLIIIITIIWTTIN